LAEASIDPVAVVDSSGLLQYANPAAVAMFGDLQGVNLVDLLHPDDLHPALDLLAQGFGAPPERMEVRARAADGS